jgi:energy-coupling factor transporter ATP-binding protein EcfA2
MATNERDCIFSKFQLQTIPNNTVHVVIGKRDSGKTTLVRSIARRFHQADIVLVFCCTEPGNKNWSGGWCNDTDTGKRIYKKPVVPYTHVFYEYNGKQVRDVLDAMMYQEPLPSGQMRRLLLIFDDCSFDRGFVNDEGLRYALMNGRNAWTDIIIVSQWMLALKPELRSQVDYVWALADNNWSNIRRLHEHWFGIIRDPNDFYKLFKELTEGYSAIVLSNNSKSQDLETLVHWFIADPNQRIPIGTRNFWIQAYSMGKSREQIQKEQRRRIGRNSYGSSKPMRVRRTK